MESEKANVEIIILEMETLMKRNIEEEKQGKDAGSRTSSMHSKMNDFQTVTKKKRKQEKVSYELD
jgi:hypothetical protein